MSDQSLETLRRKLVQAEKLASLGARVASLAHEINTPVGNSLTIAGALAEKTGQLRRRLSEQGLRRSHLEEYLDQVEHAAALLSRNLQSAGDQITNFKRVAVDQASEQRRTFDLRRVIEDVVATLRPRIRRTQFGIDVDVPEGIEMDSYPGPLGQVISNCFNNSLVHGFAGRSSGRFTIRARVADGEEIIIELADDGCGMDETQCARAFERFFTTRGEVGGSGLGLSIVQDITTGVLGGSASLSSRVGEGTVVVVRIPRSPSVYPGKDEEADERT